MSNPKVCILTTVHTANDVRVFAKEARTLVRADYEVSLIVPHDQDGLVDGVQIKAVPRPAGRVSRMTWTVFQMYRAAVQVNANVYHFHDPELIPLGLLLRVMGKKVIYDIHEDLPSATIYKQYLPYWVRSTVARLAGLAENVSSRQFSALIPATPAIGERFVSLNDNINVVQNFPYLDELVPQTGLTWDKRTCSVSYVGGIAQNRGILQMVRAMSLLPDNLSITLKLAGNFNCFHLREQVRLLAGWNRVEEMGFLDRAGVKNLLESVCAGLVLFHPEANHVRALPNKLFEYMSAGIPVIASDFPLWRDLIMGAGCGLLVDPMDPRAIADSIEYLVTHPKESEAMGLLGRQAVEKEYNWEKESEKLLDIYQTLFK